MHCYEVADAGGGVFRDHGRDSFRAEQILARDAVVEDQAERVDVAPFVELLPGELLGTHVERCPHDHSRLGQAHFFDGAGQSEIHDEHVSFAVDHDVLGLEVAVDDSLAVGVSNGAADLDEDRDGILIGEHPASFDDRAQGAAVDVVHREVGERTHRSHFVYRDDARMAQPCGDARFAPESLDEWFVGAAELRDDLECDVTIERSLAGLVDVSHAAAAEEGLDDVALGESLADGIELGIDSGSRHSPAECAAASIAELRGVAVFKSTEIAEHWLVLLTSRGPHGALIVEDDVAGVEQRHQHEEQERILDGVRDRRPGARRRVRHEPTEGIAEGDPFRGLP